MSFCIFSEYANVKLFSFWGSAKLLLLIKERSSDSNRDSSGGTAICYERVGRSRDRIPLGEGARFSAPVQTAHGAHPVSYTGVSQPPGRGINYTGPRKVLLEFVILVF